MNVEAKGRRREGNEAAIVKSSPRGWYCVKQSFFIWYSIVDATTRAVHFMGAQNKILAPFLNAGLAHVTPCLKGKY